MNTAYSSNGFYSYYLVKHRQVAYIWNRMFTKASNIDFTLFLLVQCCYELIANILQHKIHLELNGFFFHLESI